MAAVKNKKKKKKKKAKESRKSYGRKTLSFADAAEKLLKEKKKPLKYTELSKHALADQLIRTESQAPEITMYVSIRSEIKRRAERKEPQRFMFLGNGLFTLVELVAGAPTQKTKSAVEQVRESRQEAYDKLYEKLTKGNQGKNFETMVGDLLIAMGYEDVEIIGGKDDQGVDILCRKLDGILSFRIAIQCKCRSSNKEIGPKDISTLRDNLSTYQCQQGILATTTNLNQAAKDKAKEAGKEPIHFIEHDELFDLFAKFDVGLRKESINYFQVDSSDYDFLD